MNLSHYHLSFLASPLSSARGLHSIILSQCLTRKSYFVFTVFSGIPACFLSEIIAFAENLGRWGLKSEVTPSRAGTGNNYFNSPLGLPRLRVTLGGPWAAQDWLCCCRCLHCLKNNKLIWFAEEAYRKSYSDSEILVKLELLVQETS